MSNFAAYESWLDAGSLDERAEQRQVFVALVAVVAAWLPLLAISLV